MDPSLIVSLVVSVLAGAGMIAREIRFRRRLETLEKTQTRMMVGLVDETMGIHSKETDVTPTSVTANTLPKEALGNFDRSRCPFCGVTEKAHKYYSSPRANDYHVRSEPVMLTFCGGCLSNVAGVNTRIPYAHFHAVCGACQAVWYARTHADRPAASKT